MSGVKNSRSSPQSCTIGFFPSSSFFMLLMSLTSKILKYFTVTYTTFQTYFLQKDQFVDLSQRQENSKNFILFRHFVLQNHYIRFLPYGFVEFLCHTLHSYQVNFVFEFNVYVFVLFHHKYFTKSPESQGQRPVLSNVRHLLLEYLGV